MEKLLTIVVPTYNRPHHLIQTLESLCPQLPEEVILVVRDNQSCNYDFWKLISPYVDKYNIVVEQNSTNIGGCGNIAKAFESCTTKWLWIKGDDDEVSYSSVLKVLYYIRSNNEDVYIKFNSKFNGRVTGINGFASAMKENGAFNSSFFISECIYKLEKLKPYVYLLYKHLSIRFPQILIIMDYLIKNKEESCFFTSDELVIDHGLDITWAYNDLIIPYLTMFDLYRDQHKTLSDNVFKCIASTLLYTIDYSNLSIRDKFYYYTLLIFKYGLIQLIRYNYRTIGAIVLGKNPC